MPFRAIAAALKLFTRNRNRLREFGRRPDVARILKYGMAITMLLWFAIAFLNRDQEDSRLTDAVQGLWSKTTADEPQPPPPAK